jgi:hypothetical protein
LFALAVKLAIILLFLIRECDSFEVQEAGATVRVDLREAKKRKKKLITIGRRKRRNIER